MTVDRTLWGADVPEHSEQKYRVDSFDNILPCLRNLAVTSPIEGTSYHHYTRRPGNDVLKLVVTGGAASIHRLGEHEGRFQLEEAWPVADRTTGFGWFREQGFAELDGVEMSHSKYRHGDGIVGVYVIDGWLRSVMVDLTGVSER